MKSEKREWIAIAYGNMGIIFKIQGELGRARGSWQRSLDLFTELGATPKIERVQAWLNALDGTGKD